MEDILFRSDEDYDFDDRIEDDLESSFSESDKSTHVEQETNTKIITNANSRKEMINMRSQINRVKENVDSKLCKWDQLKNELQLCESNITELEKELQTTTLEIETNRINENIAAIFRLQGQLKRLEIELDGEKQMRQMISKKVEKAEQNYIESQLEEAKYLLKEEELKNYERGFDKMERENRERRLIKENKLTKNAKIFLDNDKRNKEHQKKDKEQKSLITKESIKIAHLRHSKYLKQTIEKQWESKNQLMKQISDQNKKKEMSIQKLNTELAHIKDNLAAIKSKKNAEFILKEEQEKEIRKSIIQKGGNPILEVKIKQKQIEMAKNKKQFMNNLKEKELKIADKIVSEEANLKKKMLLMPQLFQDRLKPLKVDYKNGSLLMKSNIFIEETEPKKNEEIWKTWEIRSNTGRSSVNEDIVHVSQLSNPQNSKLIEDNTNEIHTPSNEDVNEEIETDLNTPEFEGLWDTTINYKIPRKNENYHIKNKNASKMEQEIMNRVLFQLKENIIQPQIVNGKVFKGRSFQSKPDIILFENIEIGKTYHQKVVLTNTSYCINQCRFEGVSENLVDFLTIKFTSPGPLSPGMMCEFSVIFDPKLDQDIFGEINFTCQSEKFKIPVKCLTKKCKVTIDRQVIQFDTIVIGETRVQSVTLKNLGAKGTFCYIDKRAETLTEPNGKNEEKIDDKFKEFCVSHDKSNEEYRNESITTTLDDIKLWIEPYGELAIIVKWFPQVLGEYLEDLLIKLVDDNEKELNLRILGKAIDVPVFIEDQTISMDICMIDRLYQDTIIFNSRAATALKIQFHVPKEMKGHLEILPNSGFIQAGQSFKSQLKLLVRSSIYEEKCKYFDEETCILDVPISASVSNQMKAVDFNVQAILTVTDLELNTLGTNFDILDFGFCTIKETKVKSIQLINKSMLPQEFGFTGYPECIEIQPNFGYGVILPKETLEFQILFTPSKAENLKFRLCCQTSIDRSFYLSCCGIGVHPSLEISKQILSFPETSIDDQSKMDIFIYNNHTSTNIYTHEPPRIGTGPVVSVGPKTFQFIVPNDIPIFIHPRFGSINPGHKKKISIYFEPRFSENSIKTEAVAIINKKLEMKAKEQWEEEIRIARIELKKEEEKEALKNKKTVKKQIRPPSGKKIKSLDELLEAGPESVVPIDIESCAVNSDDYLKGKLSLLQKFDFTFEYFNIKCLIADGHISDLCSEIVYNPHNTLYMELHCPAVKTDLVILSNSSRSIFDFGDNFIHNKAKKILSIQNISTDTFQIRSTVLDPNGPFQVCNAIRSLKPMEITNIILSFTANEKGIYKTNWTLYGQERTKLLKLTLKGQAITPKIEFKEIINGEFNSGVVLVNEFGEKPLTVVNNSDVDVDLRFDLYSQINISGNKSLKNKNGQSVFNISPNKATIAAGKTVSVTVTFAPDHESDLFTDHLECFLFDKVSFTKFLIRGQAKTNPVYVRMASGVSMKIPAFLGDTWFHQQTDENKEEKLPLKKSPMILQAFYTNEGVLQEASGSFFVGCVKTLASSQKKNGDFSVDNLNILDPLGFSVEPSKGQLEVDTEKEIFVSWKPPSAYKIGSVTCAVMIFSTKGDASNTYLIELRGFVL